MKYNSQRLQADADTTEWFNYCDIDGMSPYTHVEYVVNEFCAYLENHGFVTDCMRQTIFTDMCAATCTMYYYKVWKQSKFTLGAPTREFSIPAKWNIALETQWNDYVNSRLVNYEFWEQFWHKLPIGYWETVIPYTNSWRDIMQYLLPHYILREVDILIDEEIVCQENNGNIVIWDDQEAEEEPDIRDMDGKKKSK